MNMLWKIYFWVFAFILTGQTVVSLKAPGGISAAAALHIFVIASLALAVFAVAFERRPLPSAVWRLWLLPSTAWLVYAYAPLYASEISETGFSAQSFPTYYGTPWHLTILFAATFAPALVAEFICGGWRKQTSAAA